MRVMAIVQPNRKCPAGAGIAVQVIIMALISPPGSVVHIGRANTSPEWSAVDSANGILSRSSRYLAPSSEDEITRSGRGGYYRGVLAKHPTGLRGESTWLKPSFFLLGMRPGSARCWVANYTC